ncbi:MAG: sulfatase [Bryobacterales bacterium]|nr:sulfatase [Bryobacterales bacterium]
MPLLRASALCLLPLLALAAPNIIFVMSDDHAVPALSAYDDRLISTPNLDRLATEGARFDSAFVTNSICTPSRAVVLTGKHSHKNGVLTLSDTFDGSQQTLAKLLQSAGYYTGMVGKWHLKSEPTGFDEYAVLPGQGLYYDPLLRHTGMWPETEVHEGYVTDVITDEALKFLEGRPNNKPFFLMYHHKAPHDVFVPKREHEGMFADPIPEPPTLNEDVSERIALRETLETIGYRHTSYGVPEWAWFLKRVRYKPEAVEGWIRDLAGLQGAALRKAQYQIYMRRYLQCVYSIDENMGRLLEYLDQSGLASNTLVVYTSDQGFFLGEHGLYDKRLMYEPAFRIPLVARWPDRIPAGTESAELVQNLDFAPTLLEAAGLPVPADMQGRSFLGIAAGSTPSDWREAVYYRYWMNRAHFNIPAHLGVRTQRYKLIYFYDNDVGPDGKAAVKGARANVRDPFWELYDLESDPLEVSNIYDDPSQQGRIKALKQTIYELRKQYGDDGDGLKFSD